MSDRLSPKERGQAIVIIALVMVVLLLFLALAVDGGNIYLHRRIAQNASDGGTISGVERLLWTRSETEIMQAVNDTVLANGIDPASPDTTVHMWYLDASGARLGGETAPELPWGIVPDGASGMQVTVDTRFSAFVAQLIGQNQLYAQGDAGAVVRWPRFAQDWVFYANCDDNNDPGCRNGALDVTGSEIRILGGGAHSNTGLHMSASTGSFYIQGNSEYGLPPSNCTGDVCPYATPVPPLPMPELYDPADFDPGGFWYNRMCSGNWARYCWQVDEIRPGDVISGGLWRVRGNMNSPRYDPLNNGQYTFVVDGSISLGGGLPVPGGFESFVGSDTLEGGSKLFIYSGATGSGGLDVNMSELVWKGVVYIPHGLAKISGSGDYSGDGSIYAWRLNLSGARIVIDHTTYYRPRERAKIILLW